MAQRSLFDLGVSKKRKPNEDSLEINVVQSVTKKSKPNATPGSSSKSEAFQEAWKKQFDSPTVPFSYGYQRTTSNLYPMD